MAPSGSTAVRTSYVVPPCEFCRHGTYIVAGTSSRTLLYLVSRRIPTISILLLSSGLDPKRLPIGDSLGKYFRTAASLIMPTNGAPVVSRSVNERPTTIGISIVSKNDGEATTRRMLGR